MLGARMLPSAAVCCLARPGQAFWHAQVRAPRLPPPVVIALRQGRL